MTTIQIPITGNENKRKLSEPIKALSDFYEAFNKRDMVKMARNWAQTGEVAMATPLVELCGVGKKLSQYTNAFLPGMQKSMLNSTTTQSIKMMRCSSWSEENEANFVSAKLSSICPFARAGFSNYSMENGVRFITTVQLRTPRRFIIQKKTPFRESDVYLVGSSIMGSFFFWR